MEKIIINGTEVTIYTPEELQARSKQSPPTLPQMAGSPIPLLTGRGVGTELKKLLKRIGITASPNCSCNRRAAEMDARGTEWCEQNIPTIVSWLREEADRRGLPFVDLAGTTIVKLAIRRAREGMD